MGIFAESGRVIWPNELKLKNKKNENKTFGILDKFHRKTLQKLSQRIHFIK